MPEQVEPGVYVEETAVLPGRIDPAPTSVTALLGRCSRGPADHPLLVQSPTDFDEVYGSDVRRSSLRRAVRDFFVNGGRTAVAVRVKDASVALANLAEHDWQLLVVGAPWCVAPERVRGDEAGRVLLRAL